MRHSTRETYVALKESWFCEYFSGELGTEPYFEIFNVGEYGDTGMLG